MKKCNDLEFLNSFNKEKKRIIDNILENLPKIKEVKKTGVIDNVNFSELNGKWKEGDRLGKSIALDALARKIEHMINEIGSPNSVQPMLESICKNKIKKHTKKGYQTAYYISDGEFLGYGHFRWDWKVYILNENEIKRVKEFFDIL
jgi:uncharacterized radical SAM superfamily Fe-S cluster-containing enzyme